LLESLLLFTNISGKYTIPSEKTQLILSCFYKNVKKSMINYAGNIKYSVTKNMYIPKIQIKNSVKNSLIEIDLKNKCSAVVTSGHYQRYFTYNGEIISHILNKFGRQGEKEISGVTVIDASGAKSDVYATIACLLKKDDASSFLNSFLPSLG